MHVAALGMAHNRERYPFLPASSLYCNIIYIMIYWMQGQGCKEYGYYVVQILGCNCQEGSHDLKFLLHTEPFSLCLNLFEQHE